MTENLLPPWLELETIYYFKVRSNTDNSPFIGKLSISYEIYFCNDLNTICSDITSVLAENTSNLNIFQGIKTNMNEIGKIFEKTTINCNYGFKVN